MRRRLIAFVVAGSLGVFGVWYLASRTIGRESCWVCAIGMSRVAQILEEYRAVHAEYPIAETLVALREAVPDPGLSSAFFDARLQYHSDGRSYRLSMDGNPWLDACAGLEIVDGSYTHWPRLMDSKRMLTMNE